MNPNRIRDRAKKILTEAGTIKEAEAAMITVYERIADRAKRDLGRVVRNENQTARLAFLTAIVGRQTIDNARIEALKSVGFGW